MFCRSRAKNRRTLEYLSNLSVTSIESCILGQLQSSLGFKVFFKATLKNSSCNWNNFNVVKWQCFTYHQFSHLCIFIFASLFLSFWHSLCTYQIQFYVVRGQWYDLGIWGKTFNLTDRILFISKPAKFLYGHLSGNLNGSPFWDWLYPILYLRIIYMNYWFGAKISSW